MFCSIITSSCKKKFEEGPLISFRSVEKRLTGKGWYYVSFIVGDTEKLDSLLMDTLYHSLIFRSKSNEVHVNFHNLDYLNQTTNFPSLTLAGKFEVNNNLLIIHHNYDPSFIYTKYAPPFSLNKDTTTQWTILRLKNKELKLKGIINNQEYLIEFERNK